MEMISQYYIFKLKEDLSKKQKINPQYSLRAYARHLGLHSATLSQVFKGTRHLPIKNIKHVVAKLSLSPKDHTLFYESFFKTKTKLDDIQIDETNDDRHFIDESYFKVIVEWEHYAVLTLFDTINFKPTADIISDSLGITANRAEVVLNNLLGCGLITVNENNQLQKAYPCLRTTEDIQSTALKLSHLETLEMGKQKLEEVEVTLRDFSAMTIALDLEMLPAAKTIIREFRQKMASLLRDGDKTDVYQLAIQFFPLTKTKTKNKKPENI